MPPPRPLATALAAVLMVAAAGCSYLSNSSEDQLLGQWRVESFNEERPLVGVNTAEAPTFEFSRGVSGYTVGGSLGCNTFGAAYTFDGATLELSEGSSTAMACILDGADDLVGEEAAMRAENQISDIIFSPPLTVEFDGDGEALIIGSDRGEVVLIRVGGGGDGEDRIPEPLSCPDGVRSDELLRASGLSQSEAAMAADPEVVETAANAFTTYGFDGDGRIIVEVQNSDTAPGDYLIITCDNG